MRAQIMTAVLLALMGLVLSGICVSSATEMREQRASEKTILGRIENAYLSSEIDSETALIYKIYAIKDCERLPDEFRTDAPSRCGTLTLLEVWRIWDELSEATQQLLKGYLGRPTLSGPESIINTTHFKIHYTTSHRTVEGEWACGRG